MRNFTLAGLLVTVCLGLLFFAKFELPAVQTGQKIKPQVETIAGRGEDGQAADRSITYEPDMKGNQLKGLIVKTLAPGGAMEKHFGLVVGDEIVQIGELGMDTFNGDPDMAGKEVVEEGYEKSKPLTVIRNGNTITLPAGASVGGGNPLLNQVNQIKPAQP